MAETSKIEWTDSTFNPWIGCTKIAPACDNCYAADMAKRYGWVEWGGPRKRTSAALWAKPRQWQKKAVEFFAENGHRRRVFCSSLADVFDNQVPDEWRDDLWKLIEATPDLDWLLLTKRPQNIAKMLPLSWDAVKGHVWLGTTVEDQKHADQNIPHLLKHDSAVRFISAEPLLGHIDLTDIRDGVGLGEGGGRLNALTGWSHDGRGDGCGVNRLNWVIGGGESGPHARLPNPHWFRSLRDQCAAAGVPYLFKQWGEHAPYDRSRVDGSTLATPYSLDLPIQRFGKKLAGRMLDGVTHDGFPG
jgi:protein gp37